METVTELVSRTGNISLESPKFADSKLNQPLSGPLSSYLDRIYGNLTESSKATFWRDVQREERPNGEAKDPLASLAAFRTYMSSPASDALCPAQPLDLSAPITDYFISSSHNTYLTGNQLYSDAAATAYTNALMNGCRCVEIDVWDGNADSKSLHEDTSCHSSSDSSSEEEGPVSHQKNSVERKTDGTAPSALPSSGYNGLKSKLGSLLKRSPSRRNRASSTADPATAAAALDPAVQIPSRPEPRVLHGHTLTKGTTFRDVCYAIRDSAFVTSDLPVIVSLEVHTCLEQQAIMVEIMEEAWKGMLIEVTPELEAAQAPPPLEKLRRKILIKVKSVPMSSTSSKYGVSDDSTDQLDSLNPVDGQSPPAKKPSKILYSLSRLAIFTKGFHFSQFSQPEAKVPGHIFSLSENAAREAYAKDPHALLEHNRRFFMRIYPYGLRINSSNLDPTFFWRCGAQVVALNWQNLDKGMMLNHGMFAEEPGWVLKPQGYRSADTPTTLIVRHRLDLTIEVLAGHNIPLPPGDTKESGFHPYVTCYVHVEQPDEANGSPPGGDNTTDSEKTSYKRRTKSATGIHPDFGFQRIQFPTLTGVIDELTFVRFKIKDDELGRDSLAAWACIKLNRLQQGYRLIHLHNCSGAGSGGTLLVKITKILS